MTRPPIIVLAGAMALASCKGCSGGDEALESAATASRSTAMTTADRALGDQQQIQYWAQDYQKACEQVAQEASLDGGSTSCVDDAKLLAEGKQDKARLPWGAPVVPIEDSREPPTTVEGEAAVFRDRVARRVAGHPKLEESARTVAEAYAALCHKISAQRGASALQPSCEEDQKRILSGKADRLKTPWGTAQLREFRPAPGNDAMTPESLTRHMRKSAIETTDLLHSRGLPPDQALQVVESYQQACERLQKEMTDRNFSPSCEDDARKIIDGTADKDHLPWR